MMLAVGDLRGGGVAEDLGPVQGRCIF
jgi:hypothetical protein